jgi:hypothetical protein
VEVVYYSSRGRHIQKLYCKKSSPLQFSAWAIPIYCWIVKRQRQTIAIKWQKHWTCGWKRWVAVVTTRLAYLTNGQVWKKSSRGLMDCGQVLFEQEAFAIICQDNTQCYNYFKI